MSNKWSEGVHKLIALTRANQIDWQKLQARTEGLQAFVDKHAGAKYRRFEGENLVGLVYVAEFGDKHLALYESRVPDMDEDGQRFTYTTANLEFITEDGELELAWPVEAPDARDLLQAVRIRTTQATEFLDALAAIDAPKEPIEP